MHDERIVQLVRPPLQSSFKQREHSAHLICLVEAPSQCARVGKRGAHAARPGPGDRLERPHSLTINPREAGHDVILVHGSAIKRHGYRSIE